MDRRRPRASRPLPSPIPKPPKLRVAEKPDEVYSRLQAFASRYRCTDCGWGADAPMIREELWLSIADKKEVLCIGCTETRLGRRLTPSDLSRCLMNGAALFFLERYYD